jgi:hypothetical protein
VAGGGRERTIDRVNRYTFVRDGYVAVRGAFDERIAGACRDMIWDSLGGQVDPARRGGRHGTGAVPVGGIPR